MNDSRSISRRYRGQPVGVRNWLILTFVADGLTHREVAGLTFGSVSWRGVHALLTLQNGASTGRFVELDTVASCRLRHWLESLPNRQRGRLFGLTSPRSVESIVCRERARA